MTLIVRTLNLAAEAATQATVDLHLDDAVVIPGWARGYVAVALDRDIAAGAETAAGVAFRPYNPATRAQVTVMLIRALGRAAEAAARVSAELDFADVAAVPI